MYSSNITITPNSPHVPNTESGYSCYNFFEWVVEFFLAIGELFRSFIQCCYSDQPQQTFAVKTRLITLAHNGDDSLYEEMRKVPKETMRTIGLEVLVAALIGKIETFRSLWLVVEIIRDAGVEIDGFHNLLICVSCGQNPYERFGDLLQSLTSKQRETVLSIAYGYGNRHVYELAETPVRPNQYSINLMWINKRSDPNQQFLVGKDEREFQRDFIDHVYKWANAYPETRVNLWYDSQMTSNTAIEGARKVLGDRIVFRDVREIDTVRLHPQAFSDQKPLYYRVDLLKAVITDYILSSQEVQYCISADFLKVTPPPVAQLFDRWTVENLDRRGIVMSYRGYSEIGMTKYDNGVENNFIILNGRHRACMESHRKVVVDLNIQRALDPIAVLNEQEVYKTYCYMGYHLAGARPGAPIETFMYGHFAVKSEDIERCGPGRDILPRKPMKYAPSHFDMSPLP